MMALAVILGRRWRSDRHCGHFGRGQKDKHDYVNGGVTRGGSGVFTGGGVALMAVTGECDVVTWGLSGVASMVVPARREGALSRGLRAGGGAACRLQPSI